MRRGEDLDTCTTVYLFQPTSDPDQNDAEVARLMVGIFAAELSDWTCDMSP